MRSSEQAPRTSRPVVSAMNDVASFMTGTPCCGSGQRRSGTNDEAAVIVPPCAAKSGYRQPTLRARKPAADISLAAGWRHDHPRLRTEGVMHLVRYQVAISLDGFIAPDDGSADWLNPYGKVAGEVMG